MLLRLFSQGRILFPLLRVCVLLALLSALDVNAEGFLPSRQRHRAQALIAARQHFKRQFSNETTTAASSSSQDSTKSSSSSETGSSETLLQSFVKSLLNGTRESTASESNTATGFLGPAVFVSATSSDSADPTSAATSTTPAPAPESTSATSKAADATTASTDNSSKAPTDSTSASITTDTGASSTSRTSLALPAIITDSTSSGSSVASSNTPSLTSTSLPTSVEQSSTGVPTTSSEPSPQTSKTSSDIPTSNTIVASLTNTFEPTGTSQTVPPTTDIAPTTTSGAPNTSFSSLSPTPTTSNTEVATSIEPGTTSQISATPSVNSTESSAFQTNLSSSLTDSKITDTAALAATSTSAENRNTTIANPTADVIPTSSSSQTAWLPTALILASQTPTTSELVTAVGPTPSAQSTEAPGVPKIVTPADGIPVSPANSTLVRIGFLESLNYPFVVQHSVTVAQIFQVLPIAIAYALQVPASYVVTRSLQPYPLSQYTATVAMVWIPQDQYDTLRVAILAVNSRLYDQPDPTAEQLVKLIDPTIPLMADGAPGTGNSGSSTGAPATDGSPNLSNSGSISGSLDNVNSQSDSTLPNSTPRQVGIGIGAAVAALGYVVLVFYGAKRFRRQSVQAENDRRGHARVSSITGERPSSPPFAQSYRSSRTSSNRPVRGQNISAPLMTENSLLL